MGDLGAAAKQAHGLHEAELLPPFAEGGSGGLDKEALDGAAAGAAFSRELLERPGVGWIGDERLGNAEGARIFGERELQGRRLDGAQLIEKDIDEMALPGDAAVEGAAAACFENEFLEQRGDLDYAALA